MTASSHSKSSQALSNVGRYVYKVSCYNGLTRRRRGIGWAELGWAGLAAFERMDTISKMSVCNEANDEYQGENRKGEEKFKD